MRAQAYPFEDGAGANLVQNGFAGMGNAKNFPNFVLDQQDMYGGGGSFKYTGPSIVAFSEQFVPVDPSRYYRLAAWAKCGNLDGSGFDAANRQYLGLACYDIDKLVITVQYFMRQAGAALTALAAPLQPGDTTVQVVSAAGWNNGANFNYSRQFLWWPYVNSQGYAYPSYSYSRNLTYHYTAAGYAANGAWAAGGISGNVIALTAPWPGPALPIGTLVMNSSSGGNYKYITQAAALVPQVWTRYEGYIGGIDAQGSNALTLFPPGTAYVRVLFLPNYAPTQATNVIRYSNIELSEVTVRNLERFDGNGDLVLQGYPTAGRPAAGTKGRLIFNTTTNRLNVDIGTGWTTPDGAAA